MDSASSSGSNHVLSSTSPEMESSQGAIAHQIGLNEAVMEALSTCGETHTCKPQQGSPVPTRLLDLGPYATDEIRLVVSSEDDEVARTASAAYAALSYCWGRCPAFTSTRSNLSERKRGFLISEMPRTLRDAVRVTRQMGLRYLWIDALCILQGCQEDWQQESARMLEVYGNAFVTIFAFGADDCQGGLSFSKSEWMPRLASKFAKEPLNRRAWALQEWLLSPRRLWMTSYGVVFDCFHEAPGSWMLGHGSYSLKLVSTSAPSAQDWKTLVEGYCSRDLTNPLDKLMAISGLARRFNALSNHRHGHYLAGHWEGGLPLSLLWHRDISDYGLPQPKPSQTTMYRAPSWSWASIDGPIYFMPLMLGDPDETLTCQILSSNICLAVEGDPFGPAVVQLNIHSYLKPLQRESFSEFKEETFPEETSPDKKPAFSNVSFYTDGKMLVDLWGDVMLQPWISGHPALHVCAITKGTNCFWGLLLVESGHNIFQRIGHAWCEEVWFEDAVERFVAIV